MRTSAAALELDFTEPSITAAKAVADTIARNGSLQSSTLRWVMEQAYGASSADGRWSLRDAYDMLELAEVLYLAKADLPADAVSCLATLTALVANLPTHTVRSQEQIELQQFFTPAPIAYLASLAARVKIMVLEKGTGDLTRSTFFEGVRGWRSASSPDGPSGGRVDKHAAVSRGTRVGSAISRSGHTGLQRL